jgi:hypothetical protein
VRVESNGVIPPTDEQGRFVRELREGSMFARVFAKAIDVFVTSAIGGLLAFSSGHTWAAALGPILFLMSDAFFSPGKWLVRLEAVTLDGKRVGLFASLSRNMTLGLPPLAAVLVRSGLFETALEPRIEGGIVGCLALVLLGVETLSMLVGVHDRRWSDHFSGTRVVTR